MEKQPVYLVTEVWVLPGAFPQLKEYRKIMNSILESFNPEYIFHSQAFEWVYGSEGEDYPTAIEVLKFMSEDAAHSAIAALDVAKMKKLENQVFSRVRCYLSRHAFPDGFEHKT